MIDILQFIILALNLLILVVIIVLLQKDELNLCRITQKKKSMMNFYETGKDLIHPLSNYVKRSPTH